MHYFFQCGTSDICAITTDKAGSNLPPLEDAEVWGLQTELDHAQMLSNFSDAIETLQHRGFCLLDYPDIKRSAELPVGLIRAAAE